MKDMGPDRMDPLSMFIKSWADGCIAKAKELKPDIIVTDLVSSPG